MAGTTENFAGIRHPLNDKDSLPSVFNGLMIVISIEFFSKNQVNVSIKFINL